MLAFNNKNSIKEKYLNIIKNNPEISMILEREEIIHHKDYYLYEDILGIPLEIAKVSQQIFNDLKHYDDDSFKKQEWFINFLSSIKVGADLTKIYPKFIRFLLIDKEFGIINHIHNQEHKNLINEFIKMINNYSNLTLKEWISFRKKIIDYNWCDIVGMEFLCRSFLSIEDNEWTACVVRYFVDIAKKKNNIIVFKKQLEDQRNIPMQELLKNKHEIIKVIGNKLLLLLGEAE